MKKIGIVTFHRAHNYGACLQAYALQKYLIQKGYDANIIDYRNENIERPYEYFNIKRGIGYNLKKLVKKVIYPNTYKKYINFNNFIDTKYRKTEPYYSIEELKKNYPKFDSYITGSDQVWNYKLTKGFDDIYFLNFGNTNTIRISYAASIGNFDNISMNLSEFKNKIKKINYISVREKDTAEKLKNILNKEVFNSIDPVFLLNKQMWDDFVYDNKIEIKEKYILCYAPSNDNKEYYDAINFLAYKTNLKVLFFNHSDKKNSIKYNKKSCCWAGPIEFVNLIKNAEYVVTTSFHAVAFASILHKKFFAVLSTNPNRLLNILNKLSLENRIVNNKNIEDILHKEMDWNEVDKKINIEAEKSKKWLEKSLGENISE